MNALRRNLLLALTVSSLVASMSLAAQDSAPVTPPARLGSKVFNWNDLVAKPTQVGERRDVGDQPTATLQRFECHITTLNAGQISHLPHTHPQEELIILQSGTLDVFTNGVTQRVGPGSLFFFASNDPHNVRNVGDQPATYLVFNFATAVTRALAGKSAAGMAVPGKLPSSVFDWAKLEAKPTKVGARRSVVDSPTTTLANFECHVTTLNSGETPHAPHHHPDEELVIVKEGLVEVTIKGVAQRAGPGSIFFFASNDEHGLRNVGDQAASYYIIRLVTDQTPKPSAT